MALANGNPQDLGLQQVRFIDEAEFADCVIAQGWVDVAAFETETATGFDQLRGQIVSHRGGPPWQIVMSDATRSNRIAVQA
jgi:hypothetical protein